MPTHWKEQVFPKQDRKGADNKSDSKENNMAFNLIPSAEQRKIILQDPREYSQNIP